MNTWPNGNVFQCCITDYRNHIGNLQDNTLEEIWNNDYMKQLRLDLLSGKKPTSCTKCFEQEENGIISFRNAVNERYKDSINDLIYATDENGYNNEFKLRYWDFRFSNLCNMKCRMCGGHLSSLWNGDELALYGQASEPEIVVNTKDKSKEDLYQLIDEQIENVDEIYFAGGEPLIMDEHYYILEKLIETGRFNVKLRYNTNLLKVKYKKWDNFSLWSKFDNVQVIGSIDAVGARAEYIRKGTVWNTVDSNIRKLAASNNILFGVSPTVNIFNVYHIPELVDYFLSAGVSLDELHLNNVLTNPKWYHISILPSDIKEMIVKKYNDHLEKFDTEQRSKLAARYSGILTYLNHDQGEDLDVYRNKFFQVTSELDKYRKESLVEACPELEKFYNDIRQQSQ